MRLSVGGLGGTWPRRASEGHDIFHQPLRLVRNMKRLQKESMLSNVVICDMGSLKAISFFIYIIITIITIITLLLL